MPGQRIWNEMTNWHSARKKKVKAKIKEARGK